MKRLLIGAALICVVLFIAGCRRDNNTPSAVMREFWTAVQSGDAAAMGRTATPETVQMIVMFGEKGQAMLAAYGGITNTIEEIDGDTAVVTVTFENGETGEFYLIRVDGNWRVHITK